MSDKIEEKPSFESCIHIINEELLKRKSKWRLTVISWMDFDDVCQKIRLHIFKKWDQWDYNRPIRPWLNRVITNQITNLIRNNYSSFLKPCAQCKFNKGGDLCEIYGQQSSDCPVFAKWASCKKRAADIKMPLSINSCFVEKDSNQEVSLDIRDENSFIDYDSKIEDFNDKIKLSLSNIEWKIYVYLYIENKSESETAKLMGYKTTEKNRSPGYKQIKKVKNKIYKIAKELVLDVI